VAAYAGKTLVGSFQGVIRLLVVIEYPQCPTVGVMASTALGSKTLAVLIVVSMAVDAGAGRILVRGRDMALFTGSYGVQTDQRKSR
jgi:hypothetical protein